MHPELPLRDIHLPAPVGWWPPAPGWWLLLILLVAAGGLLIRAWQRRRRRLAVRQSALATLERIRSEYRQTQDPVAMVQALSVLLRRVAISVDGRQTAAGLVGQDWLAYLDSLVPAPLFQQHGQALIDAPYRADADIDAEALMGLAGQWIAAVGRRGGDV